MRRYSKIEYTPENYQNCINTQMANKTPFKEHFHGSRKKLYVSNRLCATTISDGGGMDIGEISKNKFIAFLASFSRNLYEQFYKKPELYDVKKNFLGSSSHKNIAVWNTISVGDFFYNIDVKSAYWQVCHKIGYISNDFFLAYINRDEYKKAKRYCITFLQRQNKMTYKTATGESDRTIVCDVQVLRTAYCNIRYELYSCVKNVLNGTENYIEYNIDGISVLSKDFKKIVAGFKEQGLDVKASLCEKINNHQYKQGVKTKNFKRVLLK